MGRERPAGARVGSRLFRDLGGRRHRPAAVGAGDGGVRVEIRGASSLGSVEAGERPPTWNACRKSPKACGRRDRCVGIAPMPQHGQATTGGLEHAAPLERDRGTVRSAEPALGAAIGRLSLAAAVAAQEQARRAGCFWFALRSRRCASGCSVRTARRADPPGDRPTGLRGGGHTQSINLVVKRRCAMVGLELEVFFGARTSRRISDRGGAARDRATGGDAAVPAPVSSTDRELLQ